MQQNTTVAKWNQQLAHHELFARGKNVEVEAVQGAFILNDVDLQRPNKPEMEGPKTAAEEMQMMRKLYNQMVLEKQNIKGEKLTQIGGLKREKNGNGNDNGNGKADAAKLN